MTLTRTATDLAASPAAYSWTVAVFAAREQIAELRATVDALLRAASAPTLIDVMINGNRQLADAFAAQLRGATAAAPGVGIRVWSVALGGKAHAWNQYLHQVWPGQAPAFFVDGYARVDADGLQLLAAALASRPQVLAAGGVPTAGRMLRDLPHILDEGGMYGALFAFKAGVMAELKRRDFHLPLGLYGFDSLLGAVVGFGLDPASNAWDVKRYIHLHPDVGFHIDAKQWWRYSVARTQFRRIINNALRTLVVGATRNHLALRKLPPEALPRTVEDFVLGWVSAYPDEARRTLRRSPLCRLALAELRQPKDRSAAALPPALVYSNAAQAS